MAEMSGHALVVEDDPAVALVVCEILRDRGLMVSHASNRVAACQRIVTLPTLDALILDINLREGANGFDVGRFARQVIPELAIVYISGEASREAFQAHGVPCSRFLQKPFTGDELVGAVRAACVG